MPVSDFIVKNVMDHIEEQDARYSSDIGPGLWLAVLTEEVGEVARAMLEKDPRELKRELVQVAATAMQMASNISYKRVQNRKENEL